MEKNNAWLNGALRSFFKGLKRGVVIAVIFGVVMVFWSVNENRTSHGGRDAFLYRFIGIMAVFTVWCGFLGFFWHRLAENIGKSKRTLWACLSVVIGALIPVLAILLFDSSKNWLDGALVMGIIGGIFFGMFTSISQFGEGDKSVKTTTENKESNQV